MRHDFVKAVPFRSGFALLFAVGTSICSAETASEFLAFPYLETSSLSGLAGNSGLDDDDYDYGLDLFTTVESGGFLLIGEALLAREEQEIERLQFGRNLGNSKIWLGRFHNPVGYWNTQFHHGAYMETSISRPAIDEFEDDGGLIPMHLAGLLFEGMRENGNQGLGYAFALAAGPELGEKLEAIDVTNASGSHDIAITANIFHQPVIYGSNRYGLSASYTEIPAVERGFEEIRQLSATAYLKHTSDNASFTGSIYYLRNRMRGPDAPEDDDFVGGYVQTERALNETWTFYGRLEWTFAEKDDAYLALFPYHVQDRFLCGIRLDIYDQHALTLEISANSTADDDYGKVELQWAAMFAF